MASFIQINIRILKTVLGFGTVTKPSAAEILKE